MSGPDFEREAVKQDFCIKTLLEGIELASIKFSKAFNLGDLGTCSDPQALIDTLTKYGIQVRYEDRGDKFFYHVSRRVASTGKKYFYEFEIEKPVILSKPLLIAFRYIRHHLAAVVQVIVIKSEKEIANDKTKSV